MLNQFQETVAILFRLIFKRYHKNLYFFFFFFFVTECKTWQISKEVERGTTCEISRVHLNQKRTMRNPKNRRTHTYIHSHIYIQIHTHKIYTHFVYVYRLQRSWFIHIYQSKKFPYLYTVYQKKKERWLFQWIITFHVLG